MFQASFGRKKGMLGQANHPRSSQSRGTVGIYLLMRKDRWDLVHAQ